MIYTVQPGDTLQGISLKYLGTASATPTLFGINQSAIKSGSPSTLAAGEQLVIPDQMIAASKGSRTAPKNSTDVALVVNGLEYVGWEQVRIVRSMETAAASFNLTIFDKWDADSAPWPIFDQDEVKVFIGPDLLIDGYVDEVELSLDSTQHTMIVAGRDRTADLIDCSAMNRPGTFIKQSLLSIAQALAQPFGVTVVTDQDLSEAIPKFTLLPGEKVHEAISRAAIAKNFIVTSAFSGKLAITLSGERAATDAIVEGVNYLGGTAKASSVDRFSDYTVEGQGSGQGLAKNGQSSTYKDAGVSRYRPLMIHADQKASGEYVAGRAQWEARYRAAKARSAQVSVVGWRQSDGTLWQTNRIVSATLPSLGLADDLLISEVTFEESLSGGQICQMKLIRPDAYTAEQELQAEKDIMHVERIDRRKARASRGVSQAEIDAEKRSLQPIINSISNDF